MGLFSFIKDAGKKIFGDEKEQAAPTRTGPSLDEMRSQMLRKQIAGTGIKVEDLKVRSQGAKAYVSGRVATQAEKEKVVLVAGNVVGIAEVDEDLTVEKPEPEATFYTVQSGDTLSKIAQQHYGAPSKYPVIFEANRPMLEHPDKIYPGQVLRIPPAA